MVQDRLTKALVRRLQELGLPQSLINIDEFRDRFLTHGWVMFVRDGDDVVNVHLVQPGHGVKPPRGKTTDTRRPRRNR